MVTDRLPQKPDDIVVSGIGCISALGGSLETCMDNLFTGAQNCGIPSKLTINRPEHYPVFEVAESDLLLHSDSESLGRTAQLAIVAAREAIDDAGYSAKDLGKLRVGVCVGTTVGCSLNNEDFYREFREGGTPDLSEMRRFFKSNPAEAIARQCNLNGPVQTIVNACSSGADAIGLGKSWLQMGLCDLVIAGGSDELSRISYLGFISLLISDNESCKPFDRARKGLNLGEGAAMLVLSREEESKKSYCLLAGYESCCDAFHVTAPHPEGKGLKQALTTILKHGNLDAADIVFINAHGTGTPDNDKVEMKVLAEFFPGIPYFSIKGGTGHTLGAAGAIEAAITVACLCRQEIPASIGFSLCGEREVYAPIDKRTEITGDYALSQSLAFGGNNSVLLFAGNQY